ncbi:MAG: MATE family efflux transporter, partial [Clostridia bacterium]|nr:MATE family efflux transporter [Clostridia bacterium]
YMVGAFVLNNQLRLQGNSIFSMIGLVSGAIINVILDPILIFACHMGVAGAALATIIGQLVSFIILFIGCQKSSNVTIRWRNFTLKRMYYTEIISGGLPSLGRQGLASIATLLLNHFAGIYGDAAIAAFSVVTKITNTSFSVILGFGQGFQPVCGFNYGGGRYDRVRKAVIFSIHISTAFLLLVGIVIYVFASPLITLFRDDALVVAIGTDALRYQCIAMPFFGLIIIMNMFLQNIRRVLSASIMATARQGLIFIPAVLILNYFFGLWGLAVAQPVADICTFILAIPLGIPVLNHMEPIPKDSK